MRGRGQELPEEDSRREPSPDCERQNTNFSASCKMRAGSEARQLPEAREQRPPFPAVHSLEGKSRAKLELARSVDVAIDHPES